MNQFAFRLLLIATLVLNGFAAPWAMAGMAHDHGERDHQGHAMPMAEADQVVHAMHHAPESSPSHSDHGMNEGQQDAGDCCKGAVCQCGCVMPSLLMVTSLPLLAQELAVLILPTPADRASATDITPPFRPPAA